MLSLILLAAAPAVAAPTQNDVNPACRGALPSQIDATQRAKVRPLGSEPPARQIYAVMRAENGCARPVLVARRR